MHLDGVGDPDVLRLAASEGRIPVSHDENSMPAHFRDFLGRNQSPGLLIVPQDAPIGPVIESILLVWIASEAAEWIDRVAWLPL